MNKLLYITANPRPESESFSLTAGRELVQLYKKKYTEDQVIEIDLYKEDTPSIDADVFSGWGMLAQGQDFDKLSESQQKKVGRIDQLTNQFIEADKYVFVTPLWNFGFPPIMKSYIDCICVAGKTFMYTSEGPVGLLKNKKAIHIQASGGTFSVESMQSLEHGNSFIKAILEFLGIDWIESVLIEGTSRTLPGPDIIKQRALERIKEVISTF